MVPDCNLLEIDLSTGKISTYSPDRSFRITFIGGTGFGARFLYDRLEPHAEPLGADNLLMFLAGPFAGTKIPCSGRTSVVTKSPLTGLWGESDVGGTFGRALKLSGVDGLIITGKAKRPCSIIVRDGGAELVEADYLWGRDSYETHELLCERYGSKLSSMCIGTAGEKQVLLSGIVSDGKDARIAARGGPGAVMGSKLLKAVAVQVAGKVYRPHIFDRQGLDASVKETVPEIVSLSAELKRLGTSGGVVTCHDLGDFPLKNWQERSWEEIEHLSGSRLAETVLTGRYHCAGCPIGCGRVVRINEGPYQTTVQAGGPEYETMGSLGGNLLVSDLKAVSKANDLCNRYGIDTISAGQVIGFAFEAFERGYIGRVDTEGVDLLWGSGDALIHCVEMIGEQKALGTTLGQGVRRACNILGIDDPQLRNHVKGMELPSHDPRAFVSLALGYATSPRGACHLQAFSHGLEAWTPQPELGFPEIVDRFSLERKAELTARMQNLMCMFDSLKLCKFILSPSLSVARIGEWLGMVTGEQFSGDDVLLAGERVFNLKRLFNIREGITGKDDSLPPRVATGSGGEHLDELLQEYYRIRGWDARGRPRNETLDRLGIRELIEE